MPSHGPEQAGHFHRHTHSDGYFRTNDDRSGSGSALAALAITLAFALVEAIGGVLAHSLALLGDAGHMLLDATALGISAFAFWIGQRPPSRRHSYGLVRAEIVAALANSVMMIVVVIGIVIEAVRRLQFPMHVDGVPVMIVAALGLTANMAVIYLLSRGRSSLNSRAAVLHALGDLLGSVAALISGSVVYFSGWMPIDPILSVLIAALILFSTVRLLRESLNVLMEGVPFGLELDAVGIRMAKVRGVISVHDLHVWTLSSGMLALSAHVVVRDLSEWSGLLQSLRGMLLDRFDIGHATLQPEIENLRLPAAYGSVIPILPKD